MKIAVVGSGYVGLVAGACFAEHGNEVTCVDVDETKVARLRNGEIPIYEPGLSDLVIRNSKQNRLHFTTSLKDAVESCKVIFIAVGTPQDEDGAADLTHVLAVARGIGDFMNGSKIVVDKSTVPVGTAEKVKKEIEARTSHKVDVVSNPEFLKEGAALDDFMKPDRVVIGSDSEEARRVMKDLYAPFVRTNNPILFMDVVSAEITKYAANAMLATRVSFMNEIALLCDAVGADVHQVRMGIGTDSRIGMSFLFPGLGYGGSCFPKDVQALIRTGRDLDVELKIPVAVEDVNKRQKGILIERILNAFKESGVQGKRFAVWGLAFKPKTDDVREAPALTLCNALISHGANLVAYDPEAMTTFAGRFGEVKELAYAKTAYEALEGADALIICTEWTEFRIPDFEKIQSLMKGRLIFDGRNLYNPSDMKGRGFEYHSIGRPTVEG
jgi:UDPglucose 6-dehydrogenase